MALHVLRLTLPMLPPEQSAIINREWLVEFPEGLPGFEQERRFTLIENGPVFFLRSLTQPDLCFTTVPVRVIDPEYCLRVVLQDRSTIGMPADRQPVVDEVLCLAIVCLSEDQPTVNLLGPILINLASGRAVQAVRDDMRYSARHPLAPLLAEEVPCS